MGVGRIAARVELTSKLANITRKGFPAAKRFFVWSEVLPWFFRWHTKERDKTLGTNEPICSQIIKFNVPLCARAYLHKHLKNGDSGPPLDLSTKVWQGFVQGTVQEPAGLAPPSQKAPEAGVQNAA